MSDVEVVKVGEGEAVAGITKTKEAIVSLKELSGLVHRALEDGKLNIRDLSLVPGLISNLRVLVKVLPALKDELTDLDKEEFQEVFTQLVDLVTEIAGQYISMQAAEPV